MSTGNSSQSIDDTINTILPSYGMFTSTVAKSLDTHLEEDDDIQPPCYYNSRRNNSIQSDTTSSLSSGFNHLSVETSATSTEATSFHGTDENGSFIVADESTSFWKETILDNVHRLPNLTFEKHKVSEAINIEVHFTKDICEIGKVPELIDPSLFEYKQGDLLNGYVLIKNVSDKPIHFDMFYLLFEGNFMIANKSDLSDRVPVKIRKFLEMFDFSASWNEANISRLVTDVKNPYVCEDLRDPVDGSALCFGEKKIIYPNLTYKRFFTFRIPNNLLDSECNEHGLSKHVELPPTLGLSRWEVAHYPERAKNKIKDICMLDTSISYGVMARLIGRKSTFEAFGKIDTNNTSSNSTRIVNSKKEEFVILKELTNHFRVIQKTSIPTDSERRMKLLENKLMYNNLISRIKEKIDQGNELIKSIEDGDFSGSVDIGKKLTDAEIELAKCRQSYKPDHLRDSKFNPDKKEYYETFLPVSKKSITGTKNLGTLRLATPKQEYCVCYIPPVRFRNGPIDKLIPSWKFEIPLDLSVKFPSLTTKSSPQLPTIQGISAEFISLTIRSEKYPLPIEFNHDLIFNKVNTGEYFDSDLFNNNISKKFRKLGNDLYHVHRQLGGNLKMEAKLADDLKALCLTQDKSFNMIVRDFKVNGSVFKKDAIKWQVNQDSAQASVKLGVNLESVELKGENSTNNSSKSYDRFTLVPDFQSCFITRMYHVKLTVHLSNGSFSNIKVPVRIQKVV